MKVEQILALIIMGIFYIAYFSKMYAQKQRGIQTHQINKGVKSQETKRVERVMGFATFTIVIMELVSIMFELRLFSIGILNVTGLLIAAIGVTIFIISMVTMKDSWRAGISKKEKTELVTTGIYQISRNPAFLGFDLIYLGILMVFFNIPLLCITLLAVISLHLQVLQEEKFLVTMFGDSYVEYKNKVCRYIGRR